MDIKIKIVPNPLYGRPGSLVEIPYIAQVVHTGTVTAADICEACKQENPQMTEPLASLATETIMDYGSDKVVTDVVRFNLGSAFFTMEPAVSGSVPTVDAALADENERYITVVNGQSLNARIAALRPVIVNDDLGDVQFRSIETVEGEECYRNEIHGSGEFVALGKRLGGPDQKLQFLAKDGTLLSEATYVDSDLLGQRFTYRLATPPASDILGDLVLSSTGKDTPERNPKTISHEVKYVAPPEPGITGVEKETVRLEPSADQAILGTKLTELFGDNSHLTIVFNPKGGEPDHMVMVEKSEGTLTDERFEFSLQKIIESIDADEEKPADGTEIAIETTAIADDGSLIGTVRFTAVYVAHG